MTRTIARPLCDSWSACSTGGGLLRRNWYEKFFTNISLYLQNDTRYGRSNNRRRIATLTVLKEATKVGRATSVACLWAQLPQASISWGGGFFHKGRKHLGHPWSGRPNSAAAAKTIALLNVHTIRPKEQGSRNEQVSHSMIADHVAKENHVNVRNWSGAKILERGGHRRTRQVKESIWIRKEPSWDGGAYSLPTAYDCLLVTFSTSTSLDHKPDEARRWRAKRRNQSHNLCLWSQLI